METCYRLFTLKSPARIGYLTWPLVDDEATENSGERQPNAFEAVVPMDAKLVQVM